MLTFSRLLKFSKLTRSIMATLYGGWAKMAHSSASPGGLVAADDEVDGCVAVRRWGLLPAAPNTTGRRPGALRTEESIARQSAAPFRSALFNPGGPPPSPNSPSAA